MSTTRTVKGGGLVAGAMGSGKGSVLWSLRAAVHAAQRQILVQDAVKVMQRRRGMVCKHVSISEESLVLVVPDEIVGLTRRLADRETKERIVQALGLLLTRGRAVGVCVVAALQDTCGRAER
jgi:S-DNA-T family DNA segregation ATPase FtsK/SpoIIIE